MNNIVIFATYWNEIEWIEASLAQIDLIDPIEVIICDGCFDPSLPNYSTDGTRKILEKYVNRHANSTLISAIRHPHYRSFIDWFKCLKHEPKIYFNYAKMKIALSFFKKNVYRLNQMATFNYMVNISKEFKPGKWFMTYDCDQFYSDSMLGEFRNILNSNDEKYGLLCGKELTFFDNYDFVCRNYEKRDYNNMPHRIYKDTRFIPTRHPARLIKGKYRLYTDVEKKKFCGMTYHYHIKDNGRLNAGYRLGDRKPPAKYHCKIEPFTGEHPDIIKKAFL